jgi:hydroxymethylglutaryl-CoA lyase
MKLPASIEVIEVGPRDGLQSFHRIVATQDKVEIVDALIAAGLRTIEVSGFAHPTKIPQFADAEALCMALPRPDGVRYRGMAPNARGSKRAVAAGMDEIVGLITASEVYLRRNQNMTLREATAEAIDAFRIAEAAERQFTMALGLSFWCAYEGLIPDERVLELMRHFRNAGVRRFYLAASVGLESPDHVSRLFLKARAAAPDASFGFHVHNCGGRAPALVLAALDAGADWIEGAICGLGGGVAMPEKLGAVGNYATEDLVTFLNDSGIETGLDAEKIVAASRDVALLLGIEPRSFAGNGATRHALQNRTPV